MRIIAGELRGLKLLPVAGNTIRPTADKTREAIFSILGSKTHGAWILDLFAGTGAMGLEALSRGASFACLVDTDPGALTLIKKNIEKCRMGARTKIFRQDALHGLRNLLPACGCLGFDMVFMDPPYEKDIVGKALENLHACHCLKNGSLVVCEHHQKETPSFDSQIFSLNDMRHYGKTLVSFFTYVL